MISCVFDRAPAMDIRRQTAQELQAGNNVLDGRPSSGGQLNRLSAINQQIGRTSVTSGTTAADSLAALAARNDIAVGGGPIRNSLRSSNTHSVTFKQKHYSEPPANNLSCLNNTSSNVVIPVPCGPSSLTGNSNEIGILDISGGVIEPLDYEEYVQQQRRTCGNVGGRMNSASQRSQAADGVSVSEDRVHLMDFPADDIEVNVVPRKIRTVQHVVPTDEPM